MNKPQISSEAWSAAIRWWLVGLFTVIAASLCHDGTSAGEFVFLAVLATVEIVVIVAMPWVAAAPRPCARCGSPIRPGEEHACQ